MDWRERAGGDDRVGAELRHILTDKFARRLRGAIWSNTGTDPGSVNPEQFCDILWKRVPPDVDDKILAESIIWLRRRLLPELGWNGGLLCSRLADAGQLLELYFGVLRYLDRRQRNIHLIEYANLRDIVGDGWRRAAAASERSRGRAETLHARARVATEYIKGYPMRRPEPVGGDDVVDGNIVESEWFIVVPLNSDAARYWGSGTFWCTAATGMRTNFFEKYCRPDAGLMLFIFLNRRTGNVYQFEYGSCQFKDYTNNSCGNPRLVQALHDMLRKNLRHKRYAVSDIASVQGWIWRRARKLALDEDGLLHSDLGGLIVPAVVTARGSSMWYRHGLLHSWDDNPAFVQEDGSRFWYRDGALHRDGGPAIIWADGKAEWWRDGVLVSLG